MDPRGRTALITGGARIGREVAAALARRGCNVALTYNHSKTAADQTARQIGAWGAKAFVVKADLSYASGSEKVVRAVRARLGGPDILVCMASIYERRPFARTNSAALRANLSVDLESGYHLARAAAPYMRKAKAGRIVLFSDWLAKSGRPRYRGFLPYYVAKAGVIGMTECLAMELAPEILVNAIAPGPIIRPPGMSAATERAVRRVTPLGRWGGPGEIARAVLFLVETEFVTGETIRVDGGRHLR